MPHDGGAIPQRSMGPSGYGYSELTARLRGIALRPAADIVSAHSLSARNLRELPNQGDIKRARGALRHLTGVIRLQEA